MKYKYRNDKHVSLHGIEPRGEKVFDHEILGGGITLLEKIGDEEKKKVVSKKKKNGDD